jgi:4-amino-4-deoxy-L-arabinose transferase-like glycosyltransferase
MIDTQGSGAGPTRARSALTVALLVIAAGALVVRIVSIAEPLGIDQSLWASAVRGMSRGQLLYQDVWEQRPPGIYLTYLAAFHVFGWTTATVAWLDIIASALTTVIIFAVVQALSTRLTAALAAALYAVLTMPSWLYGHSGFLERSVCETFIVPSVALGGWCAVKYRDRPSALLAAGLGFFCGLAIVYKPNAGIYLPALLLWIWFYRREDGGWGAAHPRALIVAIAASAVLPVLTVVWLWQTGVLADARVAVVDFNRYYLAGGFTIGGYALDFSRAVWLRMKTDPLWLAGGIGAVVAVWQLARTGRLPPMAGLAVIWGGAAAMAIVVNGARLFNSYFINALAPLAILSAWLLVDNPSTARRAGESVLRRVVAIGTISLMLMLLVQRNYVARVADSVTADFAAWRGTLDRTRYLERFGGYDNARGYSARANEELAAYVRAHTTPDERIFLFGINGAGVYFHADRLTAHRFLRVNFFVPDGFPDPAFRLEAVTRDLAARQPRYLIFERLNSVSEMGKAVDRLAADPDIIRLLGRYELETRIEDFTLYRRTD